MNLIFFYCPFYDELRASLMNEMYVKNPKMFQSTGDDRMEWLFNFNVCKLTNFFAKAWKKSQEVLFRQHQYCEASAFDFWSPCINDGALYASLGWAYFLCITQ